MYSACVVSKSDFCSARDCFASFNCASLAASWFLAAASFAEALKRIVVKKSFSEVTVSELIRVCNVNRKTFYYHFTDVYDLLKWTLGQEAIDVVKKFDLIADYEEVILFAMDYIEIVTSTIKKVETINKVTLPKEFETFLSCFYTEAIAGALLEWIVNKEEYDRQQTIDYISVIFRTGLPAAIMQYSDEAK